MLNYNNLRGRIVSKFGDQKNFCNTTGISASKVSKLLNNKIYLSQKEICKWCEILDIELPEIPYYFFATQVDK